MCTKDEYFNQLKTKLIAVDYDDTITLYAPYPNPAPLNPEAKKYLDKLHEKGYRLVLWSARVPHKLDEAYNRCINEFGLTYLEKDGDHIIHGSSGKIVANFYIDDKSIPGKLNWKKIYKFIIKTIK